MEKFVKDSNMLKRLKEMISMGVIAEMIATEAEAKAEAKTKAEIARNMLHKNMDLGLVSELTGLDESTIRDLQDEQIAVAALA